MVVCITFITFFITVTADFLADVAIPSHPLYTLQTILMELSVLKLSNAVGLQDRKGLLLQELVLPFPQLWTLATSCSATTSILPTNLAKRMFEAYLSTTICLPTLFALKDDRLS